MKKIFSLVVALMMALTVCSFAAAENTVSTDGSTSMEKVVGALGEYFMEQNPGVTFTYNPTGSGSGSGITAVQEGRCDRPVQPLAEGRRKGRRSGRDRGRL